VASVKRWWSANVAIWLFLLPKTEGEHWISTSVMRKFASTHFWAISRALPL
jgi:hypothetical protein